MSGSNGGRSISALTSGGLVLRDIHQPPAPSWWPPAPGWWLLAAAIVLACALVLWRYWRRGARRRALARLFDAQVQGAGPPPAQLAAISELLRRAACQVDPAAGMLVGDEWLRFLDRDLERPAFLSGPGAILRDGGFRRQLAQAQVDAVRPLARSRFLAWMT